MQTVQPRQTGKMFETAERIPAFLHAASFGLIPRMPLPMLVDVMALLVWVLCSTIPTLPGAGPARYALAGYFLIGLLRFPNQMLPATLRAWPIFLVPLLCFVSAVWAPYANDAIRKGVMLSLTAFFAVYLGARLTARQLIFGYLAIESIAMLLSLMTPNMIYGTATGIFGQKNYLATHMFILYCAGLAFFLDRDLRWIVRLGAIGTAAGAAYLIYLSKSTTTIAFMIAGSGALVGHALIWEPARRMRHMRVLIITTLAVLAAAASYILFAVAEIDLFEKFLAANGKDSTLTGRTYLWDHAWRIMHEHPWTGLGANAFWRPEVGAANSILRYFFFDGFTQFSFHNSYLEIGVQLGYPGMYALIFTAAWAYYRNVRNWFTDQTISNGFFLVLATLVVIRSNTEIDLVIDFGPTMILFFIGAVRMVQPQHQAAPPSVYRPPPNHTFNVARARQ